MDFEVGEERSKVLKKNTKISTEEKSLNYFSNHNKTAQENFEILLSDIQNKIMPEYIQKYKHLVIRL